MKCQPCANDAHELCTVVVPTGNTVPEYSKSGRGRMVPEVKPCTCGCQDTVVPW